MRNDFLRDEATGDLKVVNGDFVIGPSDQQHQSRILISKPGTYKFSLLTGVGITDYINFTDDVDSRDALLKKIRLQMQMDDYKVNSLNMDNAGNINLDADPLT